MKPKALIASSDRSRGDPIAFPSWTCIAYARWARLGAN